LLTCASRAGDHAPTHAPLACVCLISLRLPRLHAHDVCLASSAARTRPFALAPRARRRRGGQRSLEQQQRRGRRTGRLGRRRAGRTLERRKTSHGPSGSRGRDIGAARTKQHLSLCRRLARTARRDRMERRAGRSRLRKALRPRSSSCDNDGTSKHCSSISTDSLLGTDAGTSSSPGNASRRHRIVGAGGSEGGSRGHKRGHVAVAHEGLGRTGG